MSYIFRRFVPETDVSKPFDCGNSDLNDFLTETSVRTPNASAGCRYLTVDALRASVDFYQKCNFIQLVEPEPDDETVLMFFDLKKLD